MVGLILKSFLFKPLGIIWRKGKKPAKKALKAGAKEAGKGAKSIFERLDDWVAKP